MIRLLRRCHLPLLALLSFAQLLVLLISRLVPQACTALVGMAALCLPLLMVLMAVPGRMRPIVLIACPLALLGAGHLLLSGPAMYAMSIGCAALLMGALSHAGKKPSEASPMFYFFCVLAQAASLFFLHHAEDALKSMLLMRGAFYLRLLLFLLAFNRISLNNATLSRFQLSEGMARTGTVLTVCVFALALLLCAMPAVVSGVLWLGRMLREGSIRLLLFLINLFPSDSAAGAAGGGMPMLPAVGVPVDADPSVFTVILERIAAVLSAIILIAGCAVLLRHLVHALLFCMRRILAHLKRYAASVTEDYEDEITDTREEGGERTFHPLRHRAKQRFSYPDTPAGRIRRRYAQLLARHSAWTASSTARENLSAEAAALYERARYSDHAPTAEDARRFEQETP